MYYDFYRCFIGKEKGLRNAKYAFFFWIFAMHTHI